MHVLLLRPVPGNDRFGLGPFFRVEPLGLEYIAAALEARGHRTTVADLRYSQPVARLIRATRAAVVAVCVDDGEMVMPAVVEALERRISLAGVPGLLVPSAEALPSQSEPFELDRVPLPSRRDVDRWRRRYACL